MIFLNLNRTLHIDNYEVEIINNTIVIRDDRTCYVIFIPDDIEDRIGFIANEISNFVGYLNSDNQT